MTEPRSFTSEEIKALYAVCKQVRPKLKVSWPDLFNREIELYVGSGYVTNFRKGNVGQEAATKIHDWLKRNHLPIARDIAPELFDVRQRSSWDALLSEHGQYGRAEAVLLNGLGLTEHSARKPLAATIRLGQDFCFALDAPFAGDVLAFEEYQGTNYGLPLGGDGVHCVASIEAGRTMLPNDPANGQPVALRESSDVGEHGYVFIVGTPELIATLSKGVLAGQPVPTRQRDSIATRLSTENHDAFTIERLHILFAA